MQEVGIGEGASGGESYIIFESSEPGHQQIAIRDHQALRIGTLGSILRAVARHKGVGREEICWESCDRFKILADTSVFTGVFEVGMLGQGRLKHRRVLGGRSVRGRQAYPNPRYNSKEFKLE